jgi:TM2 domain-containing membrane protein YozV
MAYTPREVSMSQGTNAVAVSLEAVPGLFQVFGIGHIYRGRTGAGVAIMVSYWVLQAINTALMSIWIGFITAPLTWLAYMVFSSTDVIGEKG